MDSDNATHYKKRSDVIASDYKDQNITEKEQPEELEQTLSSQEPRKKKLFLIGAIVTGVVIISVVSFFLSQKKSISPTVSPTPTPAVTTSPTASPKPVFDRSQWTLEVLNGSGVTGAAKKLADKLQDLGYKILKTGNADRSDYTVTELFVAKEMKDKQELLLADLKKEVNIASVAGELKDSTASARIIIGKELKEF